MKRTGPQYLHNNAASTQTTRAVGFSTDKHARPCEAAWLSLSCLFCLLYFAACALKFPYTHGNSACGDPWRSAVPAHTQPVLKDGRTLQAPGRAGCLAQQVVWEIGGVHGFEFSPVGIHAAKPSRVSPRWALLFCAGQPCQPLPLGDGAHPGSPQCAGNRRSKPTRRHALGSILGLLPRQEA